MNAIPRPSGAVLVSSRLTAIRGVLEEFGESYWELGQAKNALERIGQIVNASRTASGIEAGGSASLLPADVATVLGALADAAELLEHRAGQWCARCDADDDVCDDHAADLTCAASYRELAAKLGGPR